MLLTLILGASEYRLSHISFQYPLDNRSRQYITKHSIQEDCYYKVDWKLKQLKQHGEHYGEQCGEKRSEKNCGEQCGYNGQCGEKYGYTDKPISHAKRPDYSKTHGGSQGTGTDRTKTSERD